MSLYNFSNRHIGPRDNDISEMLEVVNAASIKQLIDETIPQKIHLKNQMNLPVALSESRFIEHMKEIAQKNKNYRSYIGMGYFNTILPGVIQRNILENPGWYTAYTPYQAEVAQGRLEALLNFQTMVIDLTAMELANASLLDEGTAAAEAMAMLFIPDRDIVLVQIGNVCVTLEKPEQFVNHGFGVDLLGRDERKAL